MNKNSGPAFDSRHHHSFLRTTNSNNFALADCLFSTDINIIAFCDFYFATISSAKGNSSGKNFRRSDDLSCNMAGGPDRRIWFLDGGGGEAKYPMGESGYQYIYRNSNYPLFIFDDSFWSRNGIEISSNPKLARGFFSPSGNYVIYRISSGSVFSDSKTEVWLAELNGTRRQNILEKPLAYYIADTWGSLDENKAVFGLSYEGPAALYKVDIPTGQANLLSALFECSAIDERGSLSLDGKMFAFSNYDLKVISLETGSCQMIMQQGGQSPMWSQDGEVLYYWSGLPFSEFNTINDLLVYRPEIETSSLFLSGSDLANVFSEMFPDNLYFPP